MDVLRVNSIKKGLFYFNFSDFYQLLFFKISFLFREKLRSLNLNELS